jgi:hypothetical protein
MSLSIQIFRKYKGGFLSGNPSIIIVRAVVELYELYREMLKLNNKRQSDIAELQVFLERLKHASPDRAEDFKHEGKRLAKRTQEDYERSLAAVQQMMTDLSVITYADQSLVYREARFIDNLIVIILQLDIPHQKKVESVRALLNMMGRLVEMQLDYWKISKAQTRDFFSLEEISILSFRALKRHLKSQSLEARQLHGLMNELKENLGKIRNQEQLIVYLNRLMEYLSTEYKDLESIMHESKILIRTTEKLFRQIQHEAKVAGLEGIERKTKNVEGVFDKQLKEIQRQALREYNDLRILFESRVKHVQAVGQAMESRRQQSSEHHAHRRAA